jgi:ABC-type nitrate/sulfonate/bicarbonate transport system permease component
MSASRLPRSLLRSTVALALMAAAYEALARSGAFPPALLPTLPAVAAALWSGIADGTLPAHAASTLWRVLAGMGLAVVLTVPLGILMGRVRAVEGFVLPLASALMPIPSLAWVPVFILWFGLGNATAVGVVLYAEMLAASDWGLGWVIFDAKEFLQADRMLASLAVIGLIGLAFERLVFGTLERATVQRWGMVRSAKA